VKTPREIAHELPRSNDLCGLDEGCKDCNFLDRETAARAGMIEALRWVLSDNTLSHVDIKAKLAELEGSK
jgi:hypothetical protein